MEELDLPQRIVLDQMSETLLKLNNLKKEITSFFLHLARRNANTNQRLDNLASAVNNLRNTVTEWNDKLTKQNILLEVILLKLELNSF